jgi:hypothetical protein
MWLWSDIIYIYKREKDRDWNVKLWVICAVGDNERLRILVDTCDTFQSDWMYMRTFLKIIYILFYGWTQSALFLRKKQRARSTKLKKKDWIWLKSSSRLWLFSFVKRNRHTPKSRQCELKRPINSSFRLAKLKSWFIWNNYALCTKI